MNPAYVDAFNLLCGDKIGSGLHREVFECRLRPDLVVKVEIENDWRSFANVREQQFWDDHCAYKPVSSWLAPCEYMSPDGRILLQRKCSPLRKSELPDKIPAFLTDEKIGNFGMLDGKVVCFDYALHITNPSVRMKKAIWVCN